MSEVRMYLAKKGVYVCPTCRTPLTVEEDFDPALNMVKVSVSGARLPETCCQSFATGGFAVAGQFRTNPKPIHG